jgi:hypothetical protein
VLILIISLSLYSKNTKKENLSLTAIRNFSEFLEVFIAFFNHFLILLHYFSIIFECANENFVLDCVNAIKFVNYIYNYYHFLFESEQIQNKIISFLSLDVSIPLITRLTSILDTNGSYFIYPIFMNFFFFFLIILISPLRL